MDSQIHGSVRTYLKKYHCILNRMICAMTSARLSDSISRNFMVQMIPHHRAAIEMSRNLLQYSQDAPLITIAEGIITEQTQSIENMERILCGCGAPASRPAALRRYQTAADSVMELMFRRMRRACADCNISADFMREMIPHHQGAIALSENALQYDICPELIPILQSIITSQEQGVREMKCLLSRHCRR